MWSVVTPIPIAQRTGALVAMQTNFNGYGLGWNLSDYRGKKIVFAYRRLAGAGLEGGTRVGVKVGGWSC
jgi:hypothetical protein